MISRSEAETKKIAAEFAKKIPGGSFVGLFGELGAGKTIFVKGMAEGLGIKALVTSPTFTVVNEYPPLVHVDLYRIEGRDETLGLEDYHDRIVVIEWAEKFWKKLDFQIRIGNVPGKERERVIEIV